MATKTTPKQVIHSLSLDVKWADTKRGRIPKLKATAACACGWHATEDVVGKVTETKANGEVWEYQYETPTGGGDVISALAATWLGHK